MQIKTLAITAISIRSAKIEEKDLTPKFSEDLGREPLPLSTARS